MINGELAESLFPPQCPFSFSWALGSDLQSGIRVQSTSAQLITKGVLCRNEDSDLKCVHWVSPVEEQRSK